MENRQCKRKRKTGEKGKNKKNRKEVCKNDF